MKKKDLELFKKYSPKLAEVLKLKNDDKFHINYFSKVIVGNEIKTLNNDTFEDWLENRLKPNLIFINFEDYLITAIEALETYKDIAGTDFGTSRQRDEAQLWADKIRGYLAERAFVKKLLNDFKIDCKLPHESGNLKDYLDSDVPLIKKEKEKTFRKSKLKTSIKMTKWNGVWHDVGTQYEHSDIYVQIKVNTGREHLISFLKELNFFKDVLLKKGVSESIIDDKKKDQILSKIKNFKDISLFAYVAGFRKIENLEFKYEGIKPKNIFHITSAEGLLTEDQLKAIADKEEVIPGKIKFVGIGEFSSYPRFITNTGRLKYKKEDWKNIVDQL